jgi:hypothetical protein
VRSHKNGEV